MTPDPIDEMLARVAEGPPDQEALQRAVARAQGAIAGDLHAVRPVASVGRLVLSMVAMFAVIAGLAALVLGPHGIHALSAVQAGFIFPALVLIATLAALACIREMLPAAGASLGTSAFLIAAAGLPALFAILLRSYSTVHFVHEGTPCLIAGMCVAVPTGVLFAFLMRRGYVQDWRRAGLACGTLAGLTGLAMLEMHCPNLKAIHVIVWHVAVVICSGLLGWAIARTASK